MGNQQFGKRLRRYREAAGISQERLAEAVDMSVASVSNMERGLNYPTMEHFIQIANILQVSADQLLADVVDVSSEVRTSELSDKLRSTTAEKRRQVYAVMEILLADV